MAVDRRQHHVPATYLQFFDHRGTNHGRDSQLYASEENRSFLVGVENVAVEAYLYSKKNPTDAERFFHETEHSYSRVVERIMQGEIRPPDAALVGIQWMIMHFRNAKYDFEGFDERIEAVEHSTERYLNEIFLGEEDLPEMDNAAQYIYNTWALQLIHANDDSFITSDNPALLFTIGKGGKDNIVAMMLPLCPQFIAVIRKRGKTKAISDQATATDIGRLNGLQVVSFRHFVFSAEPIEQEDRERIGNISRRYPFTNGMLATDFWTPHALNNFEPGFSFIEW